MGRNGERRGESRRAGESQGELGRDGESQGERGRNGKRREEPGRARESQRRDRERSRLKGGATVGKRRSEREQ